MLALLQVSFRIRKVPATVLLIGAPAQRLPLLVALLRASKMGKNEVLDRFSSLLMIIRVRLALWDCVSAMEAFLENLQNGQVKLSAICRPLTIPSFLYFFFWFLFKFFFLFFLAFFLFFGLLAFLPFLPIFFLAMLPSFIFCILSCFRFFGSF